MGFVSVLAFMSRISCRAHIRMHFINRLKKISMSFSGVPL